ncbi:MAG: LysR family transcriptional regulator [Oscillospiraceae bacterium]
MAGQGSQSICPEISSAKGEGPYGLCLNHRLSRWLRWNESCYFSGMMIKYMRIDRQEKMYNERRKRFGTAKGNEMNFRLYRYFVAVASTLSFSRAADNLHISQSTLSQQIQQMEEYYGVKLFERHGRSVSLTAAGIEMQKAASQMLVEQDQLAERLKIIDGGARIETYPLRIFFDSHMTQGPHLINSVIDAVLRLQQREKERISFSPRLMSADLDDPQSDLNMILTDPQVDVWLIGAESEVKQPGIRFETLFVDEFALLISKNHPLYREDLTLEDARYIMNHTTLFMIQNRSKHLRTVLDMLPGEEEVEPAIRFERSADEISVYVALGQGVSVVPQDNKNENVSSVCKAITIPNTKFYTLFGYRTEEKNPLPGLLLKELKKQIRRELTGIQ